MTQKSQLVPIYGFTTQNAVLIIATKGANAQNSLLFFALVWKVHVSFCHWSKTVKGYGEMWVILAIWEIINGAISIAFSQDQKQQQQSKFTLWE